MDAIITIDERQDVVLFNSAAQRMFGMRPGDIVGKPIQLLVPERHRASHHHTVARFGSQAASAAREMGGGDRVVHARHASGAEFPVDASISSMTDEEGRRWMTVILRDVTQREREREALVRSNLELQQFAFVASHDLRSPLRTIEGFLEIVLQSDPSLQPRSSDMLRRAKAAVRQLDELTTSLLSYARLSEGKAFEQVDMNAAAADALSLLQATVAETGAQVEVHDLPPVHGDRTQLVQLLQNLLGNAMKYSSEMPRVEVSAETGESGWTFCVRDNGIGIEPRYLRKIFEPFKRLHTQAEYQRHRHRAGHLQARGRAPRGQHLGHVAARRRERILFYHRAPQSKMTLTLPLTHRGRQAVVLLAEKRTRTMCSSRRSPSCGPAAGGPAPCRERRAGAEVPAARAAL